MADKKPVEKKPTRKWALPLAGGLLTLGAGIGGYRALSGKTRNIEPIDVTPALPDQPEEEQRHTPLNGPAQSGSTPRIPVNEGTEQTTKTQTQTEPTEQSQRLSNIIISATPEALMANAFSYRETQDGKIQLLLTPQDAPNPGLTYDAPFAFADGNPLSGMQSASRSERERALETARIAGRRQIGETGVFNGHYAYPDLYPKQQGPFTLPAHYSPRPAGAPVVVAEFDRGTEVTLRLSLSDQQQQWLERLKAVPEQLQKELESVFKPGSYADLLMSSNELKTDGKITGGTLEMLNRIFALDAQTASAFHTAIKQGDRKQAATLLMGMKLPDSSEQLEQVFTPDLVTQLQSFAAKAGENKMGDFEALSSISAVRLPLTESGGDEEVDAARKLLHASLTPEALEALKALPLDRRMTLAKAVITQEEQANDYPAVLARIQQELEIDEKTHGSNLLSDHFDGLWNFLQQNEERLLGKNGAMHSSDPDNNCLAVHAVISSLSEFEYAMRMADSKGSLLSRIGPEVHINVSPSGDEDGLDYGWRSLDRIIQPLVRGDVVAESDGSLVQRMGIFTAYQETPTAEPGDLYPRATVTTAHDLLYFAKQVSPTEPVRIPSDERHVVESNTPTNGIEITRVSEKPAQSVRAEPSGGSHVQRVAGEQPAASERVR